MKNIAIILASGHGSRYGSSVPKQFVEIQGKTILEYSIEAFESNSKIDNIIIVITPEYRDLAQKILDKNSYKKITKLLNGGLTRKESSSIAVNSVDEKEANILIHDCARPFVSQKIISNCIDALDRCDAVGVAIETGDTIVRVEGNKIISIPNRTNLRKIQTPQCFKLSVIKKAHELSKEDESFSDDCGLVIQHGLTDICFMLPLDLCYLHRFVMVQ